MERELSRRPYAPNLEEEIESGLSDDAIIVGSDPYGLAAAAFPREIGIVARVVGEPTEFWRQMSKGTFCDLLGTPATSPTQLGAFPLKHFVAEP